MICTSNIEIYAEFFFSHHLTCGSTNLHIRDHDDLTELNFTSGICYVLVSILQILITGYVFRTAHVKFRVLNIAQEHQPGHEQHLIV